MNAHPTAPFSGPWVPTKPLTVAVLGLGYVGVVTAACLSRDGHTVIGVDVNPAKVADVAAGRSPIIEPGVGDLLLSGVRSGRITTTTDAREAVRRADVVLVCVGTPATANGSVDLRFVETVVEQAAEAATDRGRLVVVVRSTCPPGTARRLAGQVAAAHPGLSVHLAANPEFLREGTAVADFDHPPFTVVGTSDVTAEAAVRALYASISAPLFVTDYEVAESVKYGANAWHATKICFANEIGRMAKAHGVDGREVMEILVQDHKLNISDAYLRPGFAYGGSCLPKDVEALLSVARAHNLDTPLLASLPASNQRQVDAAVDAVLATGSRRVAVLGLAFKPGTDDLRESPSVALIKRLIGEGIEVRIYDPAVREAQLVGANLEYIRRHLPHFEDRLVDSEAQAIAEVGAVVVVHASPQMRDVVVTLDAGVTVIDLNGAFEKRRSGGSYVGLAW